MSEIEISHTVTVHGTTFRMSVIFDDEPCAVCHEMITEHTLFGRQLAADTPQEIANLWHGLCGFDHKPSEAR